MQQTTRVQWQSAKASWKGARYRLTFDLQIGSIALHLQESELVGATSD